MCDLVEVGSGLDAAGCAWPAVVSDEGRGTSRVRSGVGVLAASMVCDRTWLACALGRVGSGFDAAGCAWPAADSDKERGGSRVTVDAGGLASRALGCGTPRLREVESSDSWACVSSYAAIDSIVDVANRKDFHVMS